MITVGMCLTILFFWLFISAFCNAASQAEAFWVWFVVIGTIAIIATAIYMTWNIVLIP